MEEETPGAPSPAQPAGMDVIQARNIPDSQPQEQVAVKPEPPPEQTGSEHKAPVMPAKHPAKPKDKPLGGSGKTDKGVGMAIAATVIIVLALAALATYAFIKAQN